ncbi:MAG: hypothetical protein DRP83_00965 [Planctomycetota bacterium]|nr:MAG: hypothetical protein DRP83_00965 [Planctomycetota bacterium]
MTTPINRRIYYMLPKAENVLRLANHNIVMNLRAGHDATLTLPNLLQRAYMVVNETGVIPYRNYVASKELPVRQ